MQFRGLIIENGETGSLNFGTPGYNELYDENVTQYLIRYEVSGPICIIASSEQFVCHSRNLLISSEIVLHLQEYVLLICSLCSSDLYLR